MTETASSDPLGDRPASPTAATTDRLALPNPTEFWQACQWQPSLDQQEQFQTLYTAVLSGNQRLNLTRITEPDDFWEKHLWDSLRGVSLYLDQFPQATLVDIGTGAGFPGLPLAIARPDWQCTLLDSTRKKIEFIQTLLPSLGLTNVVPMVGRVETLGQLPNHRERYDLALLRAVAEAAVCVEYALPLVKLGGRVVLYRGQWTAQEQQDLQAVIPHLGGAIAQVESFVTPMTQGIRHLIHLEKVSPTPSIYPRAIGIPKQHPLGLA